MKLHLPCKLLASLFACFCAASAYTLQAETISVNLTNSDTNIINIEANHGTELLGVDARYWNDIVNPATATTAYNVTSDAGNSYNLHLAGGRGTWGTNAGTSTLESTLLSGYVDVSNATESHYWVADMQTDFLLSEVSFYFSGDSSAKYAPVYINGQYYTGDGVKNNVTTDTSVTWGTSGHSQTTVNESNTLTITTSAGRVYAYNHDNSSNRSTLAGFQVTDKTASVLWTSASTETLTMTSEFTLAGATSTIASMPENARYIGLSNQSLALDSSVVIDGIQSTTGVSTLTGSGLNVKTLFAKSGATLVMDGTLAAAADLTVGGMGTVQLSASQSINSLSISGTLLLADTATLSATNGITFNGGTLSYSGTANTISSAMKIGNGTVQVGALPGGEASSDSTELTLSGSITGVPAGGTFTKTGMGTLILTKLAQDANVSYVINGGTLKLTTGNNGNAFTRQSVDVNAGGTLWLTLQDSMGYNNNRIKNIRLTGSEGNEATLRLDARQTMQTNVYLQGYATVEGSGSLNPFNGGKIYASGDNNLISAGMALRDNLTVDVSGSLKITGNFSRQSAAGTMTKTGEGTLTIAAAEGVTGDTTIDKGLAVNAGAVVNERSLTIENLSTAEGATFTNKGTLTLTDTADTSGTFTNDGGTVKLSGNTFTKNGSGTLRVTESNSAEMDVIVNGGTLEVDRSNGMAFTHGTVTVNKGATLALLRQDALGWSGWSASPVTAINLNGESEENKATLSVIGRQTQNTNINLNGYAEVTGSGSLNPFGGASTITATKGNNVIAVNIDTRADLTFDVQNTTVDETEVAGSLVFSGRFGSSWSGETDCTNATPTTKKTGAGTLTFTGGDDTAASRLQGTLQVEAGSLINTGVLIVGGKVNNAADASGGFTLTGGSFTNTGSLTILGTMTLSSSITNTGTITFGDNARLDLSGWEAVENDDGTFTYTLFTGADGATGTVIGLDTSKLLHVTTEGRDWTFGTDGTISYTLTVPNLSYGGETLSWIEGVAMTGGNYDSSRSPYVTFTGTTTATLDAAIAATQVTIEQDAVLNLSKSAEANILTADAVQVNGTLKLAGKDVLAADSSLIGTGVVEFAAKAGESGEMNYDSQMAGFTGEMVVSAGKYKLESGAAYADLSALTIKDSAAVWFYGSGASFEGLINIENSTHADGAVILDGSTVRGTVDISGAARICNQWDGTLASEVIGTGNLTLSGNNGGAYKMTVSGNIHHEGDLIVTNGNSLVEFTSASKVNNTGKFIIDGGASVKVLGTISNSDGVWIQNGSTLELKDSGGYAGSITMQQGTMKIESKTQKSAITLAANADGSVSNNVITVKDAALRGSVSGTGNLDIQVTPGGNAQWSHMYGDNAQLTVGHTGNFTVSGSGNLNLGYGNAVAMIASTVQDVTIAGAGVSLNVSGSRIQNSGTLAITSGSLTLNSGTGVDHSGGTGSVTASGGTLTVNDGAIFTTGMLTVSGGTVIANDTLTLSGLTISDGSLTVNGAITGADHFSMSMTGGSFVLSDLSALTGVEGFSGTDGNGLKQTTYTLVSASNSTLSGNQATVTVGSETYDLVASSGGITFSIVQKADEDTYYANSGTVNMGDATAAGATQVEVATGGTLNVGSSDSVGEGAIVVKGDATVNLDGATLDSSSVTVQNDAQVTISGTSGTYVVTGDSDNTVSETISGGIGVTYSGDGVKEVTGSNDYTGETTISGATVVAKNDNSFGSGSVAVQDEGALQIEDNTLSNTIKATGVNDTNETTGVTISAKDESKGVGYTNVQVSGTGAESSSATASATLNNASIMVDTEQTYGMVGITLTGSEVTVKGSMTLSGIELNGTTVTFNGETLGMADMMIGASSVVESTGTVATLAGDNSIVIGLASAEEGLAVEHGTTTTGADALTYTEVSTGQLSGIGLTGALTVTLTDSVKALLETGNVALTIAGLTEGASTYSLFTNTTGIEVEGYTVNNVVYGSEGATVYIQGNGSTEPPTGGEAVPEPTTATLSLLALAALAARRRRK